MSYEDDYEQLYEPTVADDLLLEYQEKMKNALLDSVKNMILSLQDDNARLNNECRENREKQRKKDAELSKREREIEQKERDLEHNFYKSKFSDFLEPLVENYEGYFAYFSSYLSEKCSKCNDDRKIEFKSLGGEVILSPCECSTCHYRYEPRKTQIKEINFYKDSRSFRDRGLIATPKYYPNSDDNYSYLNLKIKRKMDVFHESELEGLDRENILFSDDEECQRYCDYLNKKRGETK